MNARLTKLLTTLSDLNPSYAGIGEGMLAYLIGESKAVLEAGREAATVEVTGGVAELTSCPPGFTVKIIDHDNH